MSVTKTPRPNQDPTKTRSWVQSTETQDPTPYRGVLVPVKDKDAAKSSQPRPTNEAMPTRRHTPKISSPHISAREHGGSIPVAPENPTIYGLIQPE